MHSCHTTADLHLHQSAAVTLGRWCWTNTVLICILAFLNLVLHGGTYTCELDIPVYIYIHGPLTNKHCNDLQ